MANFAVITGTTVSNIIVADSLEIAEEVTGSVCVEYTSENPAGIGWSYDQATGLFSAPIEPTPIVEEPLPIVEEPLPNVQ